VRVPADDFVADLPHDVFDVEVAALLRDTALKHDLKQEVAQLFAVRAGSAQPHRVEYLIGLLQEERGERLVGLLAIPRTAVGPAQTIHDLLETIHFRHASLHGPPRILDHGRRRGQRLT